MVPHLMVGVDLSEVLHTELGGVGALGSLLHDHCLRTQGEAPAVLATFGLGTRPTPLPGPEFYLGTPPHLAPGELVQLPRPRPPSLLHTEACTASRSHLPWGRAASAHREAARLSSAPRAPEG